MEIVQAKCPYCGSVCKGEDDLNISKSFCHSCSTKRHSLAQQYFRKRSLVSVAGGKYILSKRTSNKTKFKKI